MIIDMPQKGDIPGLRQLWQEAFGDSEEFLDGFFSEGFSYARCLCLRMGDRPVAALYWFDCRLGEKQLAYLYAIATDKAYRGRGLCRQLMVNTHDRLKALGYAGAVLVPAEEKLFAMYEGMGYKGFCPMKEVTVAAGGQPAVLRRLTGEAFFALRMQYLPAEGILQDSAAGYLSTFTEFYESDGAIMCLSRDKDSVHFQEFLGDAQMLPGIVTALKARTARLRMPGGRPYAMYLGFSGPLPENAYLGIPLG